MNTSCRSVLFVSLAATWLPASATSMSWVQLSGLTATVTDLDPLDGVAAALVVDGATRVTMRNQFNLKSPVGEMKGLVEIDRGNLGAVTLSQPLLPTYGGASFASFGGGWNGVLESSSRADVGDVESLASFGSEFEISPYTSVTFFATLSYQLSTEGAPLGGNQPIAYADARIIFNNFQDANLSQPFGLISSLAPSPPSYGLVGTITPVSLSIQWTMTNATGLSAGGSFGGSTTARVIGTVAAVPEVPSALLLLVGIGCIGVARKVMSKARSKS